MEKELSISELAGIWNVSVPTAWSRVNKEGLKTFKKKNESNREINYVSITDEIINNYVINNNINLNKGVNNGYYEDILNNENLNKVPNDVIDAEYSLIKPNILESLSTGILNLNNDYNERLTRVYENYNERLSTVYESLNKVNEELITEKSKSLYLENREKDIASREGFYINENNELKQEINRYKQFNKLLITVIICFLLVATGLITYTITLKKVNTSYTMQSPVIQDTVQSLLRQ